MARSGRTQYTNQVTAVRILFIITEKNTEECFLYLCTKVVDAIPDCSFPYTYNGGLYYSCIENMTGISTADQPFGCINVNATPAACACSGAFWMSMNDNTMLCFIYCELFPGMLVWFDMPTLTTDFPSNIYVFLVGIWIRQPTTW